MSTRVRLRPGIILELLHRLAPQYEYPDALEEGVWVPVVCPVHCSGKLNASIKVDTIESPMDPGVLWCFPCSKRFSPVDLVMELKRLGKSEAWSWLGDNGFCTTEQPNKGIREEFVSML